MLIGRRTDEVGDRMDANKERFQEHNVGLRDCILQVKEMRLDLNRLEDRLAIREKREGILPSADPSKIR